MSMQRRKAEMGMFIIFFNDYSKACAGLSFSLRLFREKVFCRKENPNPPIAPGVAGWGRDRRKRETVFRFLSSKMIGGTQVKMVKVFFHFFIKGSSE